MFQSAAVMDTVVTKAEKKSPLPNCMRCACFKISWDPSLPYSCDVFAIKSRYLPSLEVYRSAGSHCPSFQQKS